MAPHPLDRPVWHALTGRQSARAGRGGAVRGGAEQGGAEQGGVGQGAAVRIDPAYGYFAAARDGGEAAQAALVASLRGPDDEIWLIEAAPQPTPPGTVVVRSAEILQMCRPAGPPPPVAPGLLGRIVPLDDAHAAQMGELARLTEPGPWAARTYRFGPFYGIFAEGVLAAMAGTRMRVPGYTEVSAVCTHPAWRGRGFAGALMARVLADHLPDTGFLHCYATNTGAKRLYEALGYSVRRPMNVTLLRQA